MGRLAVLLFQTDSVVRLVHVDVKGLLIRLRGYLN
jgi:hypothetical protein